MTDGGTAAASAPEPPRQPLDTGAPDVDVGRTIGRALRHDEPTAMAAEAPTDDVLVEVARELSVDPAALALAIVEERTHREPEGLVDRIVGAPVVVAHRQVAEAGTDPDDLRDRAEQWLERGHGLRITKVEGERVEGVRRRDALGKLSTSVKAAGGVGRLGRYRRTAVVTSGVEDAAAVGVEVDLIEQRGKAVLGGVATTTVAVGFVGLGALIASPFVLVVAPAAVAGGAVVARKSYGKHLDDAQTEAELMADGLARDRRPPRLRDELEARLRDRPQREIRERTKPRRERRGD